MWIPYVVKKSVTCENCGTIFIAGINVYKDTTSYKTYRCHPCYYHSTLGLIPKTATWKFGKGFNNINYDVQFVNTDDFVGVDLGCAPTDEQHPCHGFKGYEDRIEPVLNKWIKMLTHLFVDVAKYGTLVKCKRDTRYGPDWIVSFTFNKNKSQSRKFAEFMQNNLPSKWDTKLESIEFIPDIEIQL